MSPVSEPRLAGDVTGLVGALNAAGVLDAADVHVATRLCALLDEIDQSVCLAAALAVRAPRLAHVCIDLATVPGSLTSELEESVDLAAFGWPPLATWLDSVAASPLVGDGVGPHPLRLEGTRLYLDRYWRQERRIADGLLELAADAPTVDEAALAAGLDELYGPDPADRQRRAAEAAVRRRFAVVAGGPGTGKTTTVARIIVLLDAQAAATGRPRPRLALAAPTGKAAARLEESVHAEARRLSSESIDRLLGLRASTLHRLLGWRPDTHSRFRHDRTNRLPYDAIVVDETSMVSTSMMASLVEAVGDEARLILVGDPDQLASVEAGAVLGDIVGPAESSQTSPIAAGIVVLDRVHRFGGAIAELAAAIRHGDADAAIAVLRGGAADVEWLEADGAARRDLPPIRDRVVAAAVECTEAARSGRPTAALDALGAMRVLCAHRRGPTGVTGWNAQIERWIAEAIPGYGADGQWYVGRPLLVTANDDALRLYNGDTGVIVRHGAGVTVAFERAGAVVEVSPRRIAAVETLHAMTIHKSQGSQFGAVAVVLPEPTSAILTRQLLYTAVTRAQRHLVVLGSEASVRAAVERPIARATGLEERLWT